MPPNHLILCHPLFLLSLIFPNIRVFFFPMSQLFPSGGQRVGASASASVLPMDIQDWFPLGWTGWISLQSKGLSKVFSNTSVQKHRFFGAQLSLWSFFMDLGESSTDSLEIRLSQSCHLILCHPLLLLPSVFPSSSHQVAKVLEPKHQSFQWMFRVDFL